MGRPNGFTQKMHSQIRTLIEPCPLSEPPKRANDSSSLPIVDRFQRKHTSLRISVTDRCNIRCFYCMPLNATFLPRDQVLTFEEMHRLVKILAPMGIDRIRITGGEPLVRAELWKLIKMVKSVDGICEVALTTNGLLLADKAIELKRAGLDRINVSLDTINPELFEAIARRKGLDKVLAGIKAAQDAGFDQIRINAVSIKGTSESEIVPLANFARDQNLTLRFIEFMPLDAEEGWDVKQVLSGAEVRNIIATQIGPLTPSNRGDINQPSVDYNYADGKGKVGFIDSVTQSFCSTCNRIRITAEGKLRNCLFSQIEWDLRDALRNHQSDHEIQQIVRACVAAKKAGHGTDEGEFLRPEKAMFQIGG